MPPKPIHSGYSRPASVESPFWESSSNLELEYGTAGAGVAVSGAMRAGGAYEHDRFDKTLQTTHVWLNELCDEIGPDRQLAWHVLGAVLRAVRDRLPVDLAAHLDSQLPLLLRGTYYDQFRPSRSCRVGCARLMSS